MNNYLEMIKKVISNGPECEKSEISEESPSTEEVISINSIDSRSQLFAIDPDDSATWPAYMVRLYNAAVAVGDEVGANRQIAAEIAFWSDTNPSTDRPFEEN